MATDFDQVSEPTNPFTTTTSWTHTPVGDAKGAVVSIAQGNTSQGDEITGVTYGGMTMQRIAYIGDGGGAEEGASYLYFLGDLPSGPQTVEVTVTPVTNFAAWCHTVTTTSGYDTEVADVQTFGSNTSSTPSVNLTIPDFDGVIVTVIFSGQSTPDVSIGGAYVETAVVEPGAYGFRAAYREFAGDSLEVGWSMGGDDSALSAVAITDALPPPPSVMVPHLSVTTIA